MNITGQFTRRIVDMVSSKIDTGRNWGTDGELLEKTGVGELCRTRNRGKGLRGARAITVLKPHAVNVYYRQFCATGTM